MVMIGVDPHKRTHTAVAIDEHETVIGERLVFPRAGQVAELVGWADQVACRDRVWAVESAGGLGYLLAQQLLAAGEQVVDVPATLASRVRLLRPAGPTRTTRTTPDPSRSLRCGIDTRPRCGSTTTRRCCGCWRVAIPRSRGPQQVGVSAPRHGERAGPGRDHQRSRGSQALSLLEGLDPVGAVGRERHRLAFELLDEIAHYDRQRKDSKARIRIAVAHRARASPRSSGSVRSSRRPARLHRRRRSASRTRIASPSTTGLRRSNGHRATRNERRIGCRGAEPDNETCVAHRGGQLAPQRAQPATPLELGVHGADD